jgi:hypothetical protein
MFKQLTIVIAALCASLAAPMGAQAAATIERGPIEVVLRFGSATDGFELSPNTLTMRQIRKSTAAAIVGLGALSVLATPSIAASDQSAAKAGLPVQVAHMGQGQGGQWTGQPCSMGMMAPGMGGQGMMGPGMMGMGRGYGPGPGYGMAPVMIGPGYGEGKGLSSQVVPSKDLTTDDVRHFLDHRLEMHGNKRLKVSEVKEVDEDKIVVDITTVDGSLVQRFEVDRHTGQMRDIE